MDTTGRRSSNNGGHPPTAAVAKNGNREIVHAKNPYRKSSNAQTSVTSQGKQPPAPSVPRVQNSCPVGMQAFAGSSFSQAFGSVEDTSYYRKSVADNYSTKESINSRSNLQEAERAEQRAIDEAEISDRDHHAMIKPHVLSVSTKQRGNGVLNFIRNVPFAYARMVPDYMMSTSSCALFLSCKYHSLHPSYIHKRIAELKTDFKLRILLVLVDVDDNEKILLYVNKLACQQNFTLVLAWTEEEAARYLESYKALDGNDTSLIQRKEKTNFADQATEFLSGATGVNKTDSASLLTQFTSVRAIAAASQDELGLVSGLGQVKVKRLHDAFHKPFSQKRKRKRQKARDDAAVEAKLEAMNESETKERG